MSRRNNTIPQVEFKKKRKAICAKAPCSIKSTPKCSNCKSCCNLALTTWGRTYCCEGYWGCGCCNWMFLSNIYF